LEKSRAGFGFSRRNRVHNSAGGSDGYC
jgi:hypothetical protein